MGKLHDAAREGDVAAINKLLQKRGLFGGMAYDVNCRNKGDKTPLHKAAEKGHAEAARALIVAGADVCAKDEWDNTPLHYAPCNVETVRALVAAGADVGARSVAGDTPLHNAAAIGNVEAVQALVAAGADVDVKNTTGKWTPLHAAAASGHVEVVRVLVAAGADVGARAKDGDTPLNKAAFSNRVEVILALVAAGAEVGAKDQRGDTPLHWAAWHDNVETARALVAAGADVGAKGKYGRTPLDLARTDEVRQALCAPPPQPPQPPPPVPSTSPPTPASTALELYTGGAMTLASPLAASQAQGLVAALAGIGISTAVQVAGAVVTCNPVALAMAPIQLVRAVQALLQQGQYSRERLQRMVARVAAMEPALEHLAQGLQPPVSAGAPKSVVTSLCRTLLLLAWVTVQLQELQRRLQSRGPGVLRRTLELLKAGGCEQEVAALDLELRDCVAQLSAVLSIAHFTQAAEVIRAREELQVAAWQQQNEADRARDLQQLEGLVVEAVGGVQALQQQLEEQRVVLDGQVVGLQQVAEWLQRMQAGSALIVGHLEQLSSKVDGIRDGVAGMHLDVTAVRDQVAQLAAVLIPPRQGQPRPKRVPMDSLPDLAVPRERIKLPADLEGALADAKRGAFGGVVRVEYGGHWVALKVYNYTGLGRVVCKDAVHEAVLLCKANHPNIVRCYGVVYDPDSAARDSIQGSLVMEWVAGGSLYNWLQDEEELGLEGRLLLALQVAEGMRHLGEKRLVHGDLKPQNIMMTAIEAEPGHVVPQVKICDFGLSIYTSDTMHSSAIHHNKADYTPAYTSPERAANTTRSPSFEDDVYAFGILLHFIATGRPPFRLKAVELESAIRAGARPDIDQWLQRQQGSDVERQVAEQYRQLAKRCWAAQPGSRPTFEAVHRDLCGMLACLRG